MRSLILIINIKKLFLLEIYWVLLSSQEGEVPVSGRLLIVNNRWSGVSNLFLEGVSEAQSCLL